MPWNGLPAPWPFSTMEEPGQYLAQELSSDLIDAMRYAALSDSFLTHQLNESCEPQATQLSTNKESEMNELMLALEAMITRIVRAEIQTVRSQDASDCLRTAVNVQAAMAAFPEDFKQALTPLLPAVTPITAGPAFDQMVRNAVVDKPWFDEAVKAEVADAPVAAMSVDTLCDTLENNSRIHDFITEMILEVKEENLRSHVESIIDNYIDVDDMVRDAIRDMSFTVTVD